MGRKQTTKTPAERKAIQRMRATASPPETQPTASQLQAQAVEVEPQRSSTEEKNERRREHRHQTRDEDNLHRRELYTAAATATAAAAATTAAAAAATPQQQQQPSSQPRCLAHWARRASRTRTFTTGMRCACPSPSCSYTRMSAAPATLRLTALSAARLKTKLEMKPTCLGCYGPQPRPSAGLHQRSSTKCKALCRQTPR